MNISTFKYTFTCFAVAVSLSASAADPIDLGQLEPDTEYQYKAMTPVSGYYTHTQTGTMRCYSAGSLIHVYTDEAHENILQSDQDYYGPSGEKVRIYSVYAGQTVYFYNSFPLDDGTFRFSIGSEDVTLADVFPSPDAGPVSLSLRYRAEINFNIPVKCSKCTIEVGAEKAEISTDITNSIINVNWFSTLRQWYRDGKINEGDEMTVTITGIRDATNSSNRPDFGDGPGKLVLKYKMAGAPAELLREINTPNSGMPDFLTYYLPGDEKGIVSLVFSSPLDPAHRPEAMLQYGDPDNLELGLYFESPKVTIDGNMLSVNLQGVTRFPDQMVPGLPAQNTINLRIWNVKSADGQYVLTGSMASPYSFEFNYTLKSVVYRVAADWLPIAGDPLADGEEMEIWVLNGNRILFDSVDFAFTKDGEPAKISVPFEELNGTPDTATTGAMIYNLKAPVMNADPDSDITVTFGGMQCADGLDHSSDIFVRYKSATAGVGTLPLDDKDAVYYDLFGRRVLSPQKGIYVRNGKKVML